MVSEVILSFKKNVKIYIMLILITVIGLLCTGISEEAANKLSNQKTQYEDMYIEKQYYRVYDNFTGFSEDQLFVNEEESIEKLQNFYKLLNESEHFEYCLEYKQPIYIADYRGGEKNIYGYEQGTIQKPAYDEADGEIRPYTCVKALWIGDNIMEKFNLNLQEGRGFSKSDFYVTVEGKTAVILGSEYADNYTVGDVVYIDYVFYKRKAVVVGILEEGSNVIYDNTFLNLDRYVLVPFVENDTDREAFIFSMSPIHIYFLRTSGIIESKLAPSDVQQILTKYSQDVGLGDGYYITEANDTVVVSMSASIADIYTVIYFIGVMILILSSVMYSIYMFIRFRKEKRYYAIMVVNGCGRSQLFQMMMIEVVFLQLASIFPALLVTYIIALKWLGSISVDMFIRIIISVCVFAIIPAVVAAVKFTKEDISLFLKEE